MLKRRSKILEVKEFASKISTPAIKEEVVVSSPAEIQPVKAEVERKDQIKIWDERSMRHDQVVVETAPINQKMNIENQASDADLF